MPVPTTHKVRFGVFELDRQTGELYQNGTKLKLQGQPIAVLALLLERPGELVTREDIRKHLWPEDTFVDFEHSLNTHIKKLRQVLDDNADTPRYIETLPRRGYRFIARAEPVPDGRDVTAETANAISGTTGALDTPEPIASPGQVVSPQPLPPPTPRRWEYAAAAIFVFAIAAGLIHWVFRPRTPGVTAIRQLTRTGHHKTGAISYSPATDGTRVYFDEFNGGKWHIAQVSTQGGEVSYLNLPMLQYPFVAGISDDGSTLQVFDASAASLADAYWLVPLPDGSPRRIPGKFFWARLLPGGKKIVYLQSSDLQHLYTADLDGSDAHPATSFPGQLDLISSGKIVNSLAVSPDGMRVRFATADDHIWEGDLNGNGTRRLLPQHSKAICCGQWSLDGSLYVFASPDEGGYDLWAVNDSAWSRFWGQSRPVRLTNGPISFQLATPSNDGKQVFALGQIPRGELSAWDSKSGDFLSYFNGISAGFTDFSRDGQWITYVAHPQGVLWRSRIDGSERMQLTFPPTGPVINPRWSPDGRLIAFTEYGDFGRKIYLVSADGGAPLLLLSGEFQPADPSWSPDGQSIAYGGVPSVEKSRTVRTEIRILNLSTKQSRTITGSQGLFSPRWSLDGHYIAAVSEDMLHLWLYSFASDRWTPLPVPSVPDRLGIGWPDWSHDSRYLYFMNGLDIHKIRIPDGSLEFVASAGGLDIRCPAIRWENWFGLTPDDRPLVLRDRGIEEIYVLDLEYR